MVMIPMIRTALREKSDKAFTFYTNQIHVLIRVLPDSHRDRLIRVYLCSIKPSFALVTESVEVLCAFARVLLCYRKCLKTQKPSVFA